VSLNIVAELAIADHLFTLLAFPSVSGELKAASAGYLLLGESTLDYQYVFEL
jgi:hypothetical protein